MATTTINTDNAFTHSVIGSICRRLDRTSSQPGNSVNLALELVIWSWRDWAGSGSARSTYSHFWIFSTRLFGTVGSPFPIAKRSLSNFNGVVGLPDIALNKEAHANPASEPPGGARGATTVAEDTSVGDTEVKDGRDAATTGRAGIVDGIVDGIAPSAPNDRPVTVAAQNDSK